METPPTPRAIKTVAFCRHGGNMSKILPMYPAYQGSGHIHTDDDKSPMKWWQGLLTAAAILVGWVGINTFFGWLELPKNLNLAWNCLLLLVSIVLIGLSIVYALGFVRSRDVCQKCTPSRFTGKPAW